MRQLGYTTDIVIGINPVNLTTGANTGARVHMRNYDTLGVLINLMPAASGTDDVVGTLNQHTLASSGVTTPLAAITDYYTKSTAANLAGNEAWTERTQAASATLTLTNAIIPAANAALIYFDVEAGANAAGNEWFSFSIADIANANARIGSVLYIMGGLKIQGRPDRLVQPQL
jgi:hypothetical protein